MQDENDELGFDDDEEETPVAASDSGPMKQLRRHANKLEKDLKARETELEELRSFKAEYETGQRRTKAAEVFSSLELPHSAVKFFFLENPEAEPTTELVSKWAVDNGFAQASGETTDVAGFTPTTTSEGIAPGVKVWEGDEARKLLRDDPARAAKLFETGRLRLDRLDIGRDRPGEEEALAILRGGNT